MSYIETFADAGSKILQKEFRVVRSVYVDLEFLQDLRFGTLLTLIDSPEKLQYVYSQIDSYNNRYNECTMSYFPDLNITDDQLMSEMDDPDKFVTIAAVSPMTSMFYNFNTLLSMFARSNKYTVEGDNTINVFINVDNELYPVGLLELFKQNMENRFGGVVKVTYMQKPRYTLGVDFYVSHDLLVLYDFEGFVNVDPKIGTAFAADGLFSEKYIFAKPQINDKFTNLSDVDKEKGVDKMRDQLNLYCDFEYAPSEIIIFNDQPEKGGN